MPRYDSSHFDPPAPVVLVKLHDPESRATISDVSLLLDTGADVTLLPHAAVERLGVPVLAGQHYELMGFDGSRSLVSAVMLDMALLRRVYRGRYLLIDEERGILGRDIINHLAMLLDGPSQEWSEVLP